MRLRHLIEGEVSIDWANSDASKGVVCVLARYPFGVGLEVVLARLTALDAVAVWVRDSADPEASWLVPAREGEEPRGRPRAFMVSALQYARAEFLLRCYKEDWEARTAFDEMTED